MQPDDPDDNDDIIDMARKASNFIEQNEGFIRDILGGGKSLDLGSDSPLSESRVEEDQVVIVADVGSASFDSIGLDTDGNDVVIDVNGKKVEATVPDDTVTDDPDAKYNNGVLEVVFDREGGDD